MFIMYFMTNDSGMTWVEIVKTDDIIISSKGGIEVWQKVY